MTTYVVYQCSICRRKKNIPRDDVRVMPNTCTITKGCRGSLFSISQTTERKLTQSVAGLTDWYPRGTSPLAATAVEQASQVSMVTAPSSILTLAISFGVEYQEPTIVAKFIQQRPDDIPFQQFTFRLGAVSSQVSPLLSNGLTGKDINGKNLRFDQAAIDEDRVKVRVNGIVVSKGSGTHEFNIIPNKILFNSSLSIGTVVDVSVYNEVDFVEKDIVFTRNTAVSAATSTSAWGNIGNFRLQKMGNIIPDIFTVYSSSAISELLTSKMKLVGFYKEDGIDRIGSTAMFLLSSPPYENVDRYFNFCVSTAKISESFLIDIVKQGEFDFFVDSSAVEELYPPIELIINESYLKNDTFTTTAVIPTDTPAARLGGTKIIGPV